MKKRREKKKKRKKKDKQTTIMTNPRNLREVEEESSAWKTTFLIIYRIWNQIFMSYAILWLNWVIGW